jgi:WD40 repeat protein
MFFASGSYDATIRIWNTETGECVDILKGHSMHATTPTFSSDRKRLVSGSVDWTIRLWDLPDHDINSFNLTKRANNICYSPSGERVLIAMCDSTLLLIDTKTKQLLCEYKEHNNVINAIFDTDGNNIITYNSDGSICIWNLKDGTCSHEFGKHYSSLALNPSGNEIALLSYNNTIDFWNYNTKTIRKSLKMNIGEALNIRYNPKGDRIAFMPDEYTISIRDTDTGEEINQIRTDARISSYIFSIDGKILMSSWDNENIYKINMLSGICESVWKGHTGRIYDLDISSDGKYVASVSHDGTIRIWDYQSELCVQKSKLIQFNTVKFNPKNDNILLLSLDDNLVTLYDFPPLQELIDQTRERFKNRKLTPEERRKYYLE